MKPVRYVLEVRRPGRGDEVWATFESDAPWMAFHVDDNINPAGWPASRAPRRILRIKRIEHVITDEDVNLVHRVCLETEEVDGYPRSENTYVD